MTGMLQSDPNKGERRAFGELPSRSWISPARAKAWSCV
jgi:hypothetical protein